jgi:hypothetical protein
LEHRGTPTTGYRIFGKASGIGTQVRFCLGGINSSD